MCQKAGLSESVGQTGDKRTTSVTGAVVELPGRWNEPGIMLPPVKRKAKVNIGVALKVGPDILAR